VAVSTASSMDVYLGQVGLGLPLPHFMLDYAVIFDYFEIFRVISIVTSVYRPAYKINGLQTRVLI